MLIEKKMMTTMMLANCCYVTTNQSSDVLVVVVENPLDVSESGILINVGGPQGHHKSRPESGLVVRRNNEEI